MHLGVSRQTRGIRVDALKETRQYLQKQVLDLIKENERLEGFCSKMILINSLMGLAITLLIAKTI